MANNASNVVVGTTGGVSFGPSTTTAPTSATSTLDAGFVSFGYITADGVEATIDKSSNAIFAWQNSDKVRTTITEASATFKFAVLETSEAVVNAYFGGTVGTDGKIELVPSKTTKGSFVIDVVDGTKAIRYYLPLGEITSVEPVTFVNGEAVSWGITVEAYAVAGRSADIWFSEFAV